MHGFRSTAGGNPLDTFGRNLYVDTFNSAYGPGWKRENSFLMHKGTGTFCYGFYPHGSHPIGKGERYRATIIGPGVTPDVMWQGNALGTVRSLARSAARRRAAPDLRLGSPLQSRLSRRLLARFIRMVAAVVFDMDGVIIDSEQVWDEVREQLVADWGGRSRPEAQRAMMGMSSPEWSRYMHDELGLPQEPEEINAEVVRRMLERYRGDLPLLDGAVDGGALAGGVVSARGGVVLEPAADRRRARDGRHRGLLRGDGVVGGGAAREAQPGRLPGGGAAARGRAVALRSGRGLGERDPGGEGGRDGRDRLSERALRARRGGAWAGGCGDRGAWGARRSGARNPGRG